MQATELRYIPHTWQTVLIPVLCFIDTLRGYAKQVICWEFHGHHMTKFLIQTTLIRILRCGSGERSHMIIQHSCIDLCDAMNVSMQQRVVNEQILSLQYR